MSLNVGIIGLGVGEAHIDGYERNQLCKVTKLCDFSADKQEMAEKKYPDKTVVTDANEILADPSIQVVTIASYDNFHYEQILQAIEQDKHIFVEKPLCLFPEEAKEIRKRLNEKPDLQMSSNLILRKSPRFVELKQRIETGEMGEIFHVDGNYNYGRLHKVTEGWRGEIDFYSIVHGGGVHLIDLFLWMLNDSIESVYAVGNRIASEGSQFRFPDCVTTTFKTIKGVVGEMTVNYGCVRPHFHDLCIYGTKATFVNRAEEAEYYVSREPDQPPIKMTHAYPGVHKGDLISSFVDSILNQSTAEVTTDDVFQTMSVCFAIEESLQTNQPVSVDYI